jgi:hypothetical protein
MGDRNQGVAQFMRREREEIILPPQRIFQVIDVG